jgi:hypothetical protein
VLFITVTTRVVLRLVRGFWFPAASRQSSYS